MVEPPDGWTCTSCGERHGGLPPALVFGMPLLWNQLPVELRAQNVMPAVENEAIVIADASLNPHFFLRGRIQMPTVVNHGSFEWNLWAEVAENDFGNVLRRWFEPARKAGAPFRGTIACRINGYPETIGVGVMIHEREVGTRPVFMVIDEHLLRGEQEDGITMHRHDELVRLNQSR